MIKNNLEDIKKELGSTKLVVVTKYQTLEDTAEAIRCGANIIGESKIQNAISKKEGLDELGLDYKMHIIGHLQTNKVKYAIKIADMIQSVDSLKLARKIDAECEKIGSRMDVLVQLNLTGEEQKYGFQEGELEENLKLMKELKNINICGLMGMGKFGDEEKTRNIFRKLRELTDQYELEICSMGMSGDYHMAIEEGSDMVRVGSKIFL